MSFRGDYLDCQGNLPEWIVLIRREGRKYWQPDRLVDQVWVTNFTKGIPRIEESQLDDFLRWLSTWEIGIEYQDFNPEVN